MGIRFSWAKPSIEEVMTTASERRGLFQEAEREVLDELVTKMRTTQASTNLHYTTFNWHRWKEEGKGKDSNSRYYGLV